MSDDANAHVYTDNGKGQVVVVPEVSWPEPEAAPQFIPVPPLVVEPATETAPETPAEPVQQPETDTLTAESIAEPHIP